MRARAPLLCVLACLAGGCGTGSVDLFDPEWEVLLIEEGDKDAIEPEAIPQVTLGEPFEPPRLEGPGPHEVSLEQAVVASLSRNRDLSVAQLSPVIAGAFERIERGRFDAEVFADASFTREESQETARATGEQFGVLGDEGSLAAGVRQELPTGTDVEIGLSQDRSISDRAPEQQSARVGLTVTQSLLRGFGPAVNLVAVRQAQLQTRASLYELRGVAESLLADTEIAYWEYALARRQVEIFERSLDVARQQSEQLMQRIEVGVLPRTEAAAARSEVALREQALIDAKSQRRAAKLRLLRLMNGPLSEAVEINPTTPPEAPERAIDDLEDRVALALRSRPDLNEARLRLDQDRLETIRTRNGLLPRLDLFLALGKTGYADTFPKSFRELDGPTYDATVGVSFSQYLGRETAEGEYRASLATRQQQSLAVRNLEQLVELDVSLAVSEAERSRQQIAATATTRALQEETVRAELERFDVGASTALLVAQAQRDLLVAQIAEVEAIANYRVALVRLYLAEGSLLERRGVTVPSE